MELLMRILADHAVWLRSEGGARANLQGADLQWADLRGADLQWANLSMANLSEAQGLPLVPAIPDLDAKILSRIEAGGKLDMNAWHRSKPRTAERDGR